MAKLQLSVVSQEKSLINTQVDAVTAVTASGEITVLPGHIPLFTKLDTGVLRFTEDSSTQSIIISKGFLSVSVDSIVTVMADTAVAERDISVSQAEAAIKQAKETILTSEDRRERIMAEASLRRALLEIRVAQRTKRTKI
ncbi:MAG: ATP synthase F1 subunit epsilon [Patescibacteria group bacterium]